MEVSRGSEAQQSSILIGRREKVSLSLFVLLADTPGPSAKEHELQETRTGV